MNKAHKQLLKRNYEKACNDYVDIFRSMYDFRGEGFWVGDEVGGIYAIADEYYDMREIVTAVELDISKQDLEEWYDYHVHATLNNVMQRYALAQWVSGTPHPTREEINKMYNEDLKIED